MPQPSRRTVLTTCATALTTGLAGCLGDGPSEIDTWEPDPGAWPLAAYDLANRGYNPHATPPPGGVEPLWQTTADGGFDLGLDGVLAVDDHVVAYGESGLWVFDPEDGEEVWHESGAVGAAGCYDGIVYAADGGESDDGDAELRLSGYAIEDGESVLSTTVGDPDSVPWVEQLLATEEVVVVGNGRGDELFVIDRENGDEVWLLDEYAAAAIDQGSLIVGGRTTLAAYDPDDGGQLWPGRDLSKQWEVDTVTGLGTPPLAVAEGTVLTGDRTMPSRQRRSSIHAYRRRDGLKLWTNEPRGKWTSTPVVVDGVGYGVHTIAGREEADVVAVELRDGGEEWRTTVEAWLNRTVVGGETVLAYGGDDEDDSGQILAFDFEGNERWRYDLDAAPGWQSGVIAVEGVVYVATDEGEVLALG